MAIIAFVRFKERKEAMLAIQSFNEAVIRGRKISVQIVHVSAPIRSLQATKQRQGKQMQQGSQNRGLHPSQINVGISQMRPIHNHSSSKSNIDGSATHLGASRKGFQSFTDIGRAPKTSVITIKTREEGNAWLSRYIIVPLPLDQLNRSIFYLIRRRV